MSEGKGELRVILRWCLYMWSFLCNFAVEYSVRWGGSCGGLRWCNVRGMRMLGGGDGE